MARKRQLVLIKLEDPDDPASSPVPLGSAREFRESVARFNTATDGGPQKRSGTEVYHGPGIVVEIAPIDDEVRQALVTCLNEDFAWPILREICKANGWKLQDMESGQMFG